MKRSARQPETVGRPHDLNTSLGGEDVRSNRQMHANCVPVYEWQQRLRIIRMIRQEETFVRKALQHET